MRVAPLLLVAFVACQTEDGVASTTVTSAPLPAKRDGPPPGVVELDYRGEFHGAKLYVTFGSHGAVASGSCFYEADGELVTLRGGFDERGVLTLDEMGDKGPVSTVTLTSDPSGAWSGTWESADASRSGAAKLEPITHHRGEGVLVATRHTKPYDEIDVRIPVVLGLEDRAFERKLNGALEELATEAAPSDIGTAVTVDYAVPLDERGFVSFVVTARYASEIRCDGGLCIGTASGLSAAVDASVIADDVWDVVDPVKARRLVVSRKLASVGVLTRRGVSFRYDELEEGVHASAWDEIPFDELGSALRHSAFERLWKRN